MSTEPAMAPDGEAAPTIEEMVGEMIVKHGSARAALAVAVAQNEELHRMLAMTMPAVSYGFSRGWHHNR